MNSDTKKDLIGLAFGFLCLFIIGIGLYFLMNVYEIMTSELKNFPINTNILFIFLLIVLFFVIRVPYLYLKNKSIKRLLSVTRYGNLKVLNVCIGAPKKYVMTKLSSYNVRENEETNCLYIQYSLGKMQLLVVFHLNCDGEVGKIFIRKGNLSEKDATDIYRKFTKRVTDLNFYSGINYNIDLMLGNDTQEWLNNLHKVTIRKVGYALDPHKFWGSDGFNFGVDIESRYDEFDDVQTLKRNLYKYAFSYPFTYSE